MYIKDFDRFMFNKTKYKGKKYFCKYCLQCLSSEKILCEHKEDCLIVNGKQNVKLESRFISFKTYSRQISVPFKIYPDFECFEKVLMIVLNVILIVHTQEKIKNIFHVVLLIK